MFRLIFFFPRKLHLASRYVGEEIRSILADIREETYNMQGMGDSYLFRVDQSVVIDSTRRGASARYMNHSCNASCRAQIITVSGHKKVVIYSQR